MQVFVCQCGSEWMRQGKVGKGRNGKFDRICREDRSRCDIMRYVGCKGATCSAEWVRDVSIRTSLLILRLLPASDLYAYLFNIIKRVCT